MKTSHRAIKKALKSTSLKPWQRIAIERGERRIQKRQRSLRTILQSAMVAMNSAFQIRMAMTTIGLTKEERALRIAEIAINAAMGISECISL